MKYKQVVQTQKITYTYDSGSGFHLSAEDNLNEFLKTLDPPDLIDIKPFDRWYLVIYKTQFKL